MRSKLSCVFLQLLVAQGLFLSETAFAISAVQQSVLDAGIKQDDSLEVKIDKSLRLLNEKRYFNPKDSYPTPQPPFDVPYNLDGLRTAEEVLSQKIGGMCGSSAVAFAAMLMESGVSEKDIQIVAAICNPDLKIICPRAGHARVEKPKSGAAGHVFVAVKFSSGQWKLINSIGGSVYYERADWMSPEELKRRIAKEAVQVPRSAFKSLPTSRYAAGLTVMQSWYPSEVPLHTFEQRFDIVASGLVSNKNDPSVKICRFTLTDQ